MLNAVDQALVNDLTGGPSSAQRRALAKIITLLESTRMDHRKRADDVLNTLLPKTGKSFRIGISGVPGVGKSTLINKLIGEERVIAFDMPGTTRDAIEVPFERNGKPYILVDTAGLRRRGKVFEAIEKFSVVKTLQAIADCNVVILMLDAQQDISEQDAHIAGFIVEAGRALVVAVNKWDGLDAYVKEQIGRAHV